MAGNTLDDASIRVLRELVAWWRGRPKGQPARPAVRYDDSWPPLILVKLDEDQTLTSSPGDTATGVRQVGAPGAEDDLAGGAITIYSGRMMTNAASDLEGGDYVVCARINGYWQAIAAHCPAA